MIGRTLSHYEILEKLGEGGMGVVYRARDTRLGRTVAIKVLRPETVGDPERKWRFVREAKAASALNHPHIVTIHDIGSADGIDFIVMEWIAGASLDRCTANGPLPMEQALDFAIQAASALAAAHAAGIVHRDIKPGNLIVTESGQLKVLDFDLAKLVERDSENGGIAPSATPTAPLGDPRTRQGIILGTLSYMSPEQAEGKRVDARSDVFSLGVVLWELLAGRRAFDGASHLSILTAILRDQPPALRSMRSDVPAQVEAIITRCLQKDPEGRYASGADLARELAAARAEVVSPPARTGALLRRPAFLIPAALVVLALAGAAVLLARRNARERWAREVAMPEIARLVEVEDFVPALHLARRAERAIPQDPELARLVKNSATTVSVDTRPPGAEVFFASYLRPESGWERLGKTPIERAHVPLGALRWRIERPGFTTLEAGAAGQPGRGPALIHLQFTLTPDGSGPPGMVQVPGGGFQYRFASPVRLEDYWLDQFEVTNGRFKAFVDGGGYEKRGLWRHAFTREGREMSWDDAMRGFRDPTGRPGPATWELGTYPAGRQDYPVSGVSWYEAAAFCELAGKNLPTFHHWYRAADLAVFSQILRLSNFSGEGPARVGEHRGVGPFGTYDMAGNVKEWCWNEASGKRYILGGAWSDASYLYSESEQALPMQRRPEFGFRCAQYTQPLGDELAAPIERTWRDYSKEKPVSDDVFRIYAGLYAHDPAELAARVESVDDSAEHWRRETISFNAAYGGERVLARLFLPKSAAPPFQTVVYFPDSTAEVLPSSDDLNMRWFDFVMRSGRALMLPIYKGTYERSTDAPQTSPNARRDVLIQWVKDLRRSIDYLETRGDIDRDRLAFYGFSLGAVYGPIFAALEPRLKTCIIVGGGLPQRRMPPEADAINFAPRVKMPFLMVNGRQDFIRPLDVSLQPLLRSLGTPEKDKRLALLEGGHLPPKMAEVIREILDWLDRYLGPVRLKA